MAQLCKSVNAPTVELADFLATTLDAAVRSKKSQKFLACGLRRGDWCAGPLGGWADGSQHRPLRRGVYLHRPGACATQSLGALVINENRSIAAWKPCGIPRTRTTGSNQQPHGLVKMPFSIKRLKWPSTRLGVSPPVMSSPSSMLSENAYSVRLALDKNRIRPSETRT